MSKSQGPQQSAYTLSPTGPFERRNTSYANGELSSGRARVVPVVRMPARPRDQKLLAPDAIWGQYNNYRSNGLVGSVVFHIIAVGLILAATIFGHKVVAKAPEHETVTLIAPSPDSYATTFCRPLRQDCRSWQCSRSLLPPSCCTMNIRSWRLRPPWLFLRKSILPRTTCRTWACSLRHRFPRLPPRTGPAREEELALAPGVALA
jgi:hypothetical protein